MGTYQGAEVDMCAFGGDYSVSCVGYDQREVLQKQNYMPPDSFQRDVGSEALPGTAAGRAVLLQTRHCHVSGGHGCQ